MKGRASLIGLSLPAVLASAVRPPHHRRLTRGYTIDEKFTRNRRMLGHIEQYREQGYDDWKWRSGRGPRARSRSLVRRMRLSRDFRFTTTRNDRSHAKEARASRRCICTASVRRATWPDEAAAR